MGLTLLSFPEDSRAAPPPGSGCWGRGGVLSGCGQGGRSWGNGRLISFSLCDRPPLGTPSPRPWGEGLAVRPGPKSSSCCHRVGVLGGGHRARGLSPSRT